MHTQPITREYPEHIKRIPSTYQENFLDPRISRERPETTKRTPGYQEKIRKYQENTSTIPRSHQETIKRTSRNMKRTSRE